MSAAATLLLPLVDTSTPQIRANLVRFRDDRSPWGPARARTQQLVPPRGGASALLYTLGRDTPVRAVAPRGGCRAVLCVEGEVQLESARLNARLGHMDLALLPSGAEHRLSASATARVIAVDYIRLPAFREGLVRSSELRPTPVHPLLRFAPKALQQRLSPGDTRLLLGPRGEPFEPRFALEGPEQLALSMVCAPPGQGQDLHLRARAHEAYVVLGGRFEVMWGDRGEHREVLEPFDAITIPPGVNRGFRNVGEGRGCVLPILIGANHALDDIAWMECVGEELRASASWRAGWWARQLALRFARRARSSES